MGVKDDFFRLKSQWVKTRGDERKAVEKELDEFYATIITDEDKELLKQAVDEDLKRMQKEAKEVRQLAQKIALREQMAEVLPFISLAKFAKTYFNKSTSWLHQRINGNEVHGKPATFTDEEIRTLSDALKSVSGKLNAVAGKLTPSAL